MNFKPLLLLPILLFLTSCTYKEPDSNYLLSAIAFQNKNGYTVFAETVSVGTDITSTEPRIFKASGATPEKAFKNLKKDLSKGISTGHCGAIILEDKNEDFKKQVLSFCLDLDCLSSAVVYTDNIENLLSAKSETYAVGYDLYETAKKTHKNCLLYRFKDENFSCPFFTEKGGIIRCKAYE